MMNFNDQFLIIRNRLFEKRNIILIFALTIIFIILFTCLTIIQFSVENKNQILNSDEAVTYKIYHKTELGDYAIEHVDFTKEQIDSIKKLRHVELVVSDKYQFGSRFEVSEFDNKYEKGILSLKALLKDDDIKIKKGTNIKNKYELVCPNTFYPHEFDEQIYSNLFLSSNDFLNKSINVISFNEDYNEKEITLKIVGTYENKYMEAANTCYTNIETYDEIVSKYNGWMDSYDDNGNLVKRENREYRDYLLRIDSKEKINEVLSSLDDMGIEYGQIFYIDSGFLTLLYFIPLLVAIIIILLSLLIIYNFISKKSMNRLKNIGILKAIGYDEKKITTLTVNENIIVTVISYVISLFVYFILLNYLTYTLLSEVTYNSYILNVPYILMILSFIIFNLIICLMVKFNLKKIFKFSIQKQLTK